MKVKVSYTIDLEEIPNKIKEIVKKNEDLISQIKEITQEIHAGDLGVKSLNDLGRMRQLSADLSESYADCESILSGFMKAMFVEPKREAPSDDDNA